MPSKPATLHKPAQAMPDYRPVQLEGMAARQVLAQRRSANPYDHAADPRHWIWLRGWLLPKLRALRAQPRRRPRRHAVGRVTASRETFDVSRTGSPWLLSEDRALIWMVLGHGWKPGDLAPVFRRTPASVRTHLSRLKAILDGGERSDILPLITEGSSHYAAPR